MSVDPTKVKWGLPGLEARNLEKIKEGLKRYAKKTTASPEAARECLRRIGILDADGNLTKRYRS